MVIEMATRTINIKNSSQIPEILRTVKGSSQSTVVIPHDDKNKIRINVKILKKLYLF
jgi:hypothetical protein